MGGNLTVGPDGVIWHAQDKAVAKFDSKTGALLERWTEYVLPEPYSHDRRTWIDNSTDPVTVWYVDHGGYLVRVQPLD
jgi:hypothetical protein